MHSKLSLRRQLLAVRRQVADQELRFATREATKRIMQLVDWSAVDRAHIYTAKLDWHEIGTRRLIARIRKEYPKVHIDTSAAVATEPIPTERYDIIIVPVLGFDEAGYRLGLGRGWYDRFLSTQHNARKIGLAYNWGLRKRIPHEPHDVPLDTIIAV